ncbi:MAG: metallophosphoesterase [Planctomycetes bacterium]|nr:metallophosphoesterase [Planctomycetota bacterium]
MFDLIGDIHGYANHLVRLLELLGYEKRAGVYAHPERQVIFLGDFIDRGPQIREVLQIARNMVEAGRALAVLGNHELNALAYHTPDPARPQESLRRHSPKNIHQHEQTKRQLSSGDLNSYLDWFRTLPLWLELDGLRVVHACWDRRQIAEIARFRPRNEPLSDEFLTSAYTPGLPLFAPVEVVAKGKEGPLPAGVSFEDKERNRRTAVRLRWYLSPAGQTYRTYAFETHPIECDEALSEDLLAEAEPYPEHAPPVFIGHYWLAPTRPATLSANVACLDYSVAKEGFLCAYRWSGESQLSNENFVWT